MPVITRKRKRARMGLREIPQWRSQRHKKHVRAHHCLAEGKAGHVCEGIMEAMHKRTQTDGCKDVKPSDYWTCPGCSALHKEQHNTSEQAVERKYGFNMGKACEEMQRSSPLAAEIREHRKTHQVAWDRAA